MIRIQRALPPLISVLLVWHPLFAQEIPTNLNIAVLQGEGAANRAGGRASEDATVRVEDQNQKPVTGATVVFTLPTSGATGEFEGGSTTATLVTDAKGVASVPARNLKINDVSGTMQILVNVNYRGVTANGLITEFTVAPNGVTHSKKTGKVLLILGLVAGAAAGALVATRSSGGSNAGGPGGGGGTTPATIVLTIGSSSVSAPH